MKTISMSFILFSLCTISSLSSAAGKPSAPVLDIAGEELLAGADYYILSVIRGAGGGGLALDSTGNETCPLDAVVQKQLDIMKGLPVYFRPVDPNDGVVRLSTDLNVIFHIYTICVQSTQWQLDFDESIQRYFVSTGGVVGNPGPDTLSNWFKIEEYNGYYKLVFCPSVCDTCRPVCGDVRILVKDNKRRLILTLNKDERPFMVKFQRFEDSVMTV